jgi:predicted metal-binding membrane protein
VDVWEWLEQRPWLLPGGALLAAGLFQFSGLKAKCLTECRHPAAKVYK